MEDGAIDLKSTEENATREDGIFDASLGAMFIAMGLDVLLPWHLVVLLAVFAWVCFMSGRWSKAR